MVNRINCLIAILHLGVGGNDDFDVDRKPGSRPGSGDRTNSDFPKRGRGGSTIITNSGDTFFGIPPGTSVK